jgi:hypothetical protein
MSMPTREEVLRWFPPVDDDPELLARRQQIIDFLLETSPQTRQRLIHEELMEGRLIEARVLLRRVLARRELTSSKDDDARIEACTDLETLQRWLDQAITAVSVSDALE